MVEYYWVSITVIWLLAYVPHFIKGGFMAKKGIRSNADPRADPSKFLDEGITEKDLAFVRRAGGAHNNSLESFAPWAAAVLMAHARSVSPDYINACAIAFTVFRGVYIIVYLFIATTEKLAGIRSLIWTAGIATTLALMIKSFVP